MLRKLKTNDIFKMSKILKKMNLKNELKVAEEGKKIKTQEQIGLELILAVFENLHLAQGEVNEFLSDLVGMSVEEFEQLEIEKVFEIIEEFKAMPGISSFLKRANQLTK
jgi:hypothetical protein